MDLFGTERSASKAIEKDKNEKNKKKSPKVEQTVTRAGPDQKKHGLGVAVSTDAAAKLEAKASELLRACASVCECCGAKASEAGLS